MKELLIDFGVEQKLENLPVVILSMSRYDYLSSASLRFAEELSKEQPVIYVDHPYTMLDVLKKWNDEGIQKRKKAVFSLSVSKRLISITSGLTILYSIFAIPINWLPPSVYKNFQWLNEYAYYRIVKKALKKLNIHEFILINSFNPFYGFLLQNKLKPKLTIYQCRDDISSAHYVSKHGPRMEIDFVKKADMVVCTSRKLKEKLKPFNINTTLLPNAVDENFLKKKRNFQKKEKLTRIGYAGLIGERMDLALIQKIASSFPDSEITLIGPVDHQYIGTAFDKLDNIKLHGLVPYHELPNYLKEFDVSIIPFIKNELTKSIYPLKINEYLAIGLPVITTTFSQDLEDFNSTIYKAADNSTFIDKISQAFREDSTDLIQQRIEFARQNTWSGRIQKLKELIRQTELK